MKNSFKVAIRAIFTNKSRSFLTTLGVIIGVSSVVLLTAIGDGLSSYVTEQFEQLGSNTVLVYPGEIFGEDGGFNREAQTTALANSKLASRDVADIKKIREYVDLAVPINFVSDEISYQGESVTSTIVGTTHEYTDAQGNADIEKGQFLSRQESETGKRVIVLGFAVADELFGNVDPIGKRVQVGNQTFSVIGVTKEVGSTFGGPSFDTYSYIPLETLYDVYDTENVLQVVVKVKSAEVIPEAIAEIEKTLSKRLDEGEFSVFDQSEILDTINQILGVLTLGLGGIASISLLVGGIGIMNIMLVSVTERTREIGLRKALGATPNAILVQFIIEAAVLSVLGGIIGVVIAFLGTLAIQSFFPAKVTLDAVALAFGVSLIVGVIFGAAPARRAAKLSPIEALRYE